MTGFREPDPGLESVIRSLTCATCKRLLGLPEQEEIMLEDARDLVREAYCHGSLDAEDICFS